MLKNTFLQCFTSLREYLGVSILLRVCDLLRKHGSKLEIILQFLDGAVSLFGCL